ncbi:dihydropteroate synthase [Nocardioides litoris]|uniref:dihydropteroate synthase n=1 Tax=Nocardioides litoris TaxID=1926648 RepID=UPI0011215BC3|nr:dihydropteroate synthase [Nocardioides litoris]
MISLAALAALAGEHAADLDLPVAPLLVGDREVDTDERAAVMGVVNLSGDSSYRDSVATTHASAVRRGKVLAAQGADVVDVGAESSQAVAAKVGADEQVGRLVPVVRELAGAGVVVSVESYEPPVVAACLEAGARMVNLTGSDQDAAMFDLAAEHGASVVLCHVHGPHARDLDGSDVDTDPFPRMLDDFGRRLDDARARGVRSAAVDPGLGFGFRLDDKRARRRHQTAVLLASFRLRRLGVPVCQSLPHAFELFEDQYRTAEGMFAVLAHLGGVGLHRTHEVPHVVAVLEAMRELPVRTDDV